jgi:crotonobetainyl-CoA:carnitine CoA-transferase CaiB-like acyl-CoA transferase
MSRRPLEGIRVVEFGVWHAGPGAGAILGDLGAEVIKIESLAGDPERKQGNFGPINTRSVDRDDWCVLFDMSNRNKKSLCIDIARPEGYEVLRRLVEKADVFMTNLRNDTTVRYRVDYESIRLINPTIVHLGVSAYGAKGPLANEGGFDSLGQAISGLLFLRDQDDPAPLQALILDQLAAITASHAAITALLSRTLTGEGQSVHTSLYGAATWMTHANLLFTSALKKNLDLTTFDRRKNSPLRTTFKCGDGRWVMSTNHPEHVHWPTLCRAIGLPGLVDDPRFTTREDRLEHSDALFDVLDAKFREKTSREWIELARAEGLMFTPIQRVGDVLTDEQARANGYVVDFRHEYLGELAVPGFPVEFSGAEAGMQSRAPERGEHSREVLEAVGYSPEEIERLHSSGVALLREEAAEPAAV